MSTCQASAPCDFDCTRAAGPKARLQPDRPNTTHCRSRLIPIRLRRRMSSDEPRDEFGRTRMQPPDLATHVPLVIDD